MRTVTLMKEARFAKYGEILKTVTLPHTWNNLDGQDFMVLKPMHSPIDKIQNRFRWRIIIKGNMSVQANTIINDCLQNIYDANYKNTRVTVDVNPNSMI